MLILCDMNNVILLYLMLIDYVYYNPTFINHERSNYLQTQILLFSVEKFLLETSFDLYKIINDLR